MSLRWFRPLRSARLNPNPTDADLRRMARHPSAYAPTAAEVLTPTHLPAIVSDTHPLLRAVLDRPEDDATRLVFAEYIHGTDPARAEFIRLQLNGDPATRLLAEHGLRWAEAFAPWGARELVYRRGFVEAMSLTGRSFISLGAGLFDRTTLREVRLIAVNFLVEELLACPHLAKLDVLNLRGNQLDSMRVAIESRVEMLGFKLQIVWQ